MARKTVLKNKSKGKPKKTSRPMAVKKASKKLNLSKKNVKKSAKDKVNKLVKKSKSKLKAKSTGSTMTQLFKSIQTEVYASTGSKELAATSYKFLSEFRNDPNSAKDLASTILKVAKLGDELALERTLEAISKPKETQLKVDVGGSLYWIAVTTKEPDAVLFSAQSLLDFGESPVVAKRIASSLLFIAKQTKDPYAVVRSAMAISKLKDNPNAGMRMANILYSYVNHQKGEKDIGSKVAAVADQFVKTPMS